MSGDNTGLMLMGVGGGGCRFAAAAQAVYGAGLTAIGFDTDEAAIRDLNGALPCQLIGATRLNKQGTGGLHANGRLAAQDDLPAILAAARDAQVVVVMTCLGGGTGGGAVPVILKALRAEGKVTLTFATLPFAFEGAERHRTAERDRPILEQSADGLVLVPLDDLHAGLANLVLPEAMRRAEALLASGLCLLWRLLHMPAFIRFDPARLRNMLVQAGSACLGQSTASGEGRAVAAVAALERAPLLRGGKVLAAARTLVIGILAGPDLRLEEIGSVMARMGVVCRKDVHIEMGVVLDTRFEGRIELVALAFANGASVETRPESAARGGLPGMPLGGAKDAKLSVASSGPFRNVEKTVYKGEDLDVPTYQRRGIRLER